MSLSVVNSNNLRTGTCPHGLPLGACPICSGMMGGGAQKRADFSAKPGEMSYAECAAIGAFLRAQKLAQQNREADYQLRLQNIASFQNNLQNAITRTLELVKFLQGSTFPLISKPIAFILNTFVIKGLVMIKNFPTVITNFITNLSNRIIDISDKLTAIFGELKNAISERLSKTLGLLKKKIKSLFKIFNSQNTDNDDKEIEDSKRTFNVKTFIHKLYKKLRRDNEN